MFPELQGVQTNFQTLDIYFPGLSVKEDTSSPHVCLLFLHLDRSHHLFIVLHRAIVEVPCNPPGDGVLQ